jgi:hypothetical protein
MLTRLGISNLTTLLTYGKEWRKHRQLFQEGLRKSVMPSYAQLQTEKVNVMLEQLLLSPEKFREHFKWYDIAPKTLYPHVTIAFVRRLSAATVMAMTFGYDYPPGQVHDRFVELAEQTASGVTTLFLPESTLINIFPFLMHIPPWVPGATTQKIAADIRKSLNGYRNEPFDYLKREVVRILSVLPGESG